MKARPSVAHDKMETGALYRRVLGDLARAQVANDTMRPRAQVANWLSLAASGVRELELRGTQLTIPFGWVDEVPSDGRDIRARRIR